MLSEHIVWAIFISLFSLGIIYNYELHFLILFGLSFYIARRLRVCSHLLHTSSIILRNEKHLPNHLLKELIVYLFLVLCVCFCLFPLPYLASVDKTYLDLVQGNSKVFLIFLVIWIILLWTKKLTKSEILHLSSVNNLTLGYGTAIWYYKNYLNRILPEVFLEKVRQYQSKEGVELPHKLYILCPKSCTVKKYIDNTDCIQSSKDLPPHEIDHGGIIERKYSVSVYKMKHGGDYFRCALEYAQPLKALLALKDKGIISLSEMDTERETFIKNLLLMLKDHKNSYEVCELVEFDDEEVEIHEILSCLPSVQAFKQRTKE